MRRYCNAIRCFPARWLAPLLILALAALPLNTLAPVRAQGDFSPEEQAALDAIQQALGVFLDYDSYTLTVEQQVAQVFAFDSDEGVFTMDQTVSAEGSISYRRAPGQTYDDRLMDLTQNITQIMSDSTVAEPQSITIGPIQMRMVVADDHIYLRMDAPPALAAYFPSGWQDITGGTSDFPGLDVIDMDSILRLGQSLSLTYLDEFLAAVTDVELLDPEPGDTETALLCRLTVDPAALLEAVGLETMASLFAAGMDETMDVTAFITAMFSSPNTQYQMEIGLDADGVLRHYIEITRSDTDITAVLNAPNITPGTTITLTQDIVQRYAITSANMPVDITAPDLTATD